MKTKKNFEEPELDIITLEDTDIITTSDIPKIENTKVVKTNFEDDIFG